MATTVLRVRIDEDVKAQLEAHANELKTTLPQVVRWVLGEAAQKPAVELLPVPMPEVETK